LPNIKNEELKKILITEDAIKYLEEHPSYYGRAFKIYGMVAVSCEKKAVQYNINQQIKKLNNLRKAIKCTLSFFQNKKYTVDDLNAPQLLDTTNS
jgi:hypothetical protein